MKDLIKKLLRENLEEISQKPVFGSGWHHNIYQSSQYPDRLYKVGNSKTVNEWVRIFKAYPKYFPKIYNVFPYKKNPYYTVVEIEKLNTNEGSREFTMIDDFLFDEAGDMECNDEFISILNFFETDCYEILKEIAYERDKKFSIILDKWVKFLQQVAPIIKMELGRDLDLHVGNVAYDAQGNLKLIDI